MIKAEEARDKFKIDNVINKIEKLIKDICNRQTSLCFYVKSYTINDVVEIIKILEEYYYKVTYLNVTDEILIQW